MYGGYIGDNGKEHGNYYIEYWGYMGDNGKGWNLLYLNHFVTLDVSAGMQYAAESLSAKAFLDSVDALVSTPFGRGMKGFAKIRGTILGNPRMRIIMFWGRCWGSLFNYHDGILS